MTPKEKAAELIEKFKDYVMIDYRSDEEPIFMLQKQCALIAVEEILNTGILFNYFTALTTECEPEQTYEFWTNVKIEITNL